MNETREEFTIRRQFEAGLKAKSAMRSAAWWIAYWSESPAATSAQRKSMKSILCRLRALGKK